MLECAAMHAEPELPSQVPLLACLPFVLMLLAIAVMPLAAHPWWESNRNKFVVSLLLGVPTGAFLCLFVDHGSLRMFHAGQEYLGFIALLGSLYVISGGILVSGSLAGTPLANTALLAIGSVVANVIGTTGASMVLIRPLLRANESRVHKTHVVIFFIFIVSNVGGCLTPLGDPPLFLGFLRGVPFTWTLQLWKEWAFMTGALLVVFNFVDQFQLNREEKERTGSQLEEVEAAARPFRIDGWVNVALLAGVVGVIFACGQLGSRLPWPDDASLRKELVNGVQILSMVALAFVSWKTTARSIREGNRFTWAPIGEVAVLFAGIFATMVPALLLLETNARTLPLREPWQFFWATGLLSSFLDNAPTYLTFASAASGLLGTSQDHLNELVAAAGAVDGVTLEGAKLLVAISLGAVFMGANTYIGNGPNFMVKAIAEESGVKMPTFLGYLKWSGAIVLPLCAVVTLVFLGP
jgi:Na+/H+ antiporter NhaD/arsenite permease-like protein